MLPGTNTPLRNFYGGNCAAIPEATLAEIVAQSCNTPFVGISEELGNEPFEDEPESIEGAVRSPTDPEDGAVARLPNP